MSKPRPSSFGRLFALVQHHRTHTRMTVALMGSILLAGVVLGYMPAESSRLEAMTRLQKAEQRSELGAQLAGLRNELSLYKGLVPKGINLTEWAEYLHSGVEESDVRLVFMEPKAEMRLGPCTALTWALEVEGDFGSLCGYLLWIESGERLLRVDRISMEVSNKQLAMSLIVRGLVRQ